ncbi:MAG TPA: CmcJ/NvfI family oxidoreductase [Myxococcaceae bacterium]|nr:CmcJ/NvfI family oxidoreductase [Myxococcaceae bacterium]
MNPSIAQITQGGGRPATVIAPLLYLGRCPEVPVSHVGTPPPGTPADNCEYLPRRVIIHDARETVRFLSLDRNGFELWHAPSAVGEFLDEDQVRRHYYPEVAALVLAATGGETAHVFDHLVRRREPGRPPMTLGARSGPFAGPAGRVHVDYTEGSGARRFGTVLEGQEPHGRFAIVNVWRSIGSAPVLDTPLALCDARSVWPGELVRSELRYPGRTGEFYLLRHRPDHLWSYVPEMRRDEVLVFKQYDSDREVARFVPHAAFDHPAMPPDAPPRQSIEARVLVTFR